MQDDSNNDTVNDRKRSIGSTEEEDLVTTAADGIIKDVDSTLKKARLDQDGSALENDAVNGVDGSITEEDPANKGRCRFSPRLYFGVELSKSEVLMHSRFLDSLETAEARDPHTGLTEAQTQALERAKQYAREIQEEVLLLMPDGPSSLYP